MTPAIPETGSPLTLRERKKRRTRRDLTETALRLFIDQGYEATTLAQLADAAEVSTRTFFRFFPSKEAVALAAETELWDAYVDEVHGRQIHSTVLDALREALVSTVTSMDEDWLRRFLATRGLIARTPALRDRSDLTSLTIQDRLAKTLEEKLGTGRDVRLRLLGEIALSAWRCAARNWIRSLRNGTPELVATAGLVREINDTFDAIPASLVFAAE
jgi:AcrR family transcriptional regulator